MNASSRQCYGCHEPLPNGISFCAKCGKQNSSPDAQAVATAKADMKIHAYRAAWKRFTVWYKGWFTRSGW